MKVAKLNGKLLTNIKSKTILGGNTQEKTVTPSTERQVITADSGYTCLDKVIVEPQSGVPESVLNSIIDRTITSIESSVTSIGGSALANCRSLKSASFPNATTLDSSVFQFCTSLTSVYLPNVITTESYTFYNCTSLTSISLPKVENIMDYAFAGCSNLSLFDFRGATKVPTLMYTNAFNSTPSTKKIVVPDNLYDTWITSTNWSATGIVEHIIKASDYEASL